MTSKYSYLMLLTDLLLVGDARPSLFLCHAMPAGDLASPGGIGPLRGRSTASADFGSRGPQPSRTGFCFDRAARMPDAALTSAVSTVYRGKSREFQLLCPILLVQLRF